MIFMLNKIENNIKILNNNINKLININNINKKMPK